MQKLVWDSTVGPSTACLHRRIRRATTAGSPTSSSRDPAQEWKTGAPTDTCLMMAVIVTFLKLNIKLKYDGVSNSIAILISQRINASMGYGNPYEYDIIFRMYCMKVTGFFFT